MAQIPQYTAQERVRPPQMLQAKVDMTTGSALQGVGNAITGLAGRMAERNKQKDDLKDRNEVARFNLDMAEQFQLAQETMPEDGTGFYDSFTKNVYGPARDQMLGRLSNDNREKYDIAFADGTGAATEEWYAKAAEAERNQGYIWAGDKLDELTQTATTLIDADPSKFEEYKKSGMDAIDEAPITTAMKRERKDAWEQTSQVAYLDRMMQTDPEFVLKELKAPMSMLAPKTQFGLLSRGVQWKETGHLANNPSKRAGIVSPAGAIGWMQVMPGTAFEIAKDLGDTDFPVKGSYEDIYNYLSRQSVNIRYGEYYLQKQLTAFNGDAEAALIAYNGGASRARKWLANGRNDSGLPKETRNYKNDILARLPGMYNTDGSPDSVVAGFVWTRKGANTPLGDDDDVLKNVDPGLKSAVLNAFSSLGIKEVRLNSATRDHKHNAEVGGASKSQHLPGEDGLGRAFDINVSGYSVEQRKKIILALSANGIGGIGVGNSIIHADVGGRRSWSYGADGKAVSGVPKEYQDVIDQHLGGSAKAPGGGGRFSTLKPQTRQAYLNEGARMLEARQREEEKASSFDKHNVSTDMQKELDLYLATGKGSDDFDTQRIVDMLGEDRYYKWRDEARTNASIFEAVDGMAEMTDIQLAAYKKQKHADPTSPTYDPYTTGRVSDAVASEADRITSMRTTAPADAALENGKVKELWSRISDDPFDADPAHVKEYLDATMAKQAEFNITEGARSPLPKDWSYKVGRVISTIPTASKNFSNAQRQAMIVDLYDDLQERFGVYTDEVILRALVDYKGVDEANAKVVTSLMESLQAGGSIDNLRKRVLPPPADAEEKGFFSTIYDGVTEFFSPETVEPMRKREYTGETGQPTGETSTSGRPIYNGDNGEVYSEKTITFEQDGKWITFPTVDENGKVMKEAQIADYVRKNGPIDPITGEKFPVFDTLEEAKAYAKQRSSTREKGGVRQPTAGGRTRPKTVIDNVPTAEKVKAAKTKLDAEDSEYVRQSIVQQFGQDVLDAALAGRKTSD
jgi:hypothetical protein